jgi:hypothetical protein
MFAEHRFYHHSSIIIPQKEKWFAMAHRYEGRAGQAESRLSPLFFSQRVASPVKNRAKEVKK